MSRRSRRKKSAKPPPAAAAESAPAKPKLRQRIGASFVIIWNWTILLAAIAAALVCARLTLYFWMSAGGTSDGGVVVAFHVLAGVLAAAATVYLAWQIWHGVRYFRHRRRRK